VESIGAVVGILVALFWLVVWWRIFVKLGWPGILSLLMLIPIVVPIMLVILAWSDWPIERDLYNIGMDE
jgi:predicted membrane metal-binding protein